MNFNGTMIIDWRRCFSDRPTVRAPFVLVEVFRSSLKNWRSAMVMVTNSIVGANFYKPSWEVGEDSIP